MQLTWFLGRQGQFRPIIATQGSGGRELPSQRASNLPRIKNLIIVIWSSVILVDDQVNLFVDRFCLGPFAVWEADRANRTRLKASTNWKKPTKSLRMTNWWSQYQLSIERSKMTARGSQKLFQTNNQEQRLGKANNFGKSGDQSKNN